MMAPSESARPLRRPLARRALGPRLPAGSGGTGRRLAGRLALGRVAARQARLLRQQGEMLREEFQAVLGPIEAAALREAALPLQGLTLEALVSRTELLLHGIGERVADWSARGGLLAQAHARLAPVLSSAPLLEQVRNLAALKDTLR